MMRKHIYYARDLACKTPYGAVSAGEEITFSLYPPRSAGTEELSLFIAQEDNIKEQHRIRLKWCGLDGASDCYRCTYRPIQPGLYWYYFRMQNQEGTFYISRGFGGVDAIGLELADRFQITVYDGAYAAPDWFGKGITYNIFPDRFWRTQVPSATGYRAERVVHESWDEIPNFKPNAQGEILNNDFFGGNLKGIQEKLPRLAALSVRTMYLNPIFEAFSNHRYDTGDYKKIDPMLGTEEDFAALCDAAEHYGIRIVLDGVFNHTGFDSAYFNGYGHYETTGAFQSQASVYAGWYDFQEWPQKYSAWWGILTLPQVNERNTDYQQYIVQDTDSVVRHWLRKGAAGWRLDVADELPDDFIAALNQAARSEKADALVLGEVWEDASNKIAYEERRRYFQGGELDSVMNYPLRDAILQYLSEGHAEYFAEAMETLRENYPKDVFFNLMNIIGTHDTPRILSVLGSDDGVWKWDKAKRAEYTLQAQEYERGVKKLKIAATIQFTMPGSPCIYYGDEVGMQGYEDPLNRRTYPWGREDAAIFVFYQQLCAIRADSIALQEGELQFLRAEADVLVFARKAMEECMVIAVNRGASAQSICLPFAAVYNVQSQELWTEADKDGIIIAVEGESAQILRCANA